MTDGSWAAMRPDTAGLMLVASSGPDLDDVLTVLVRHEPDYVLVTVAGEVDFASAAGLRERLFTLASAGRPLVADLDRVSFIDAAGLGVLAGAARQAAAHGVRSCLALPLNADGKAVGALNLSRLSKPIVLVFGSYTCPKLRGSAPSLLQLITTWAAFISKPASTRMPTVN